MRRRSAVSWAAGAWAFGTPAIAQSPPRYAALSLVGDRISVVIPQMTAGVAADPNRRPSWDEPSGAFDKVALGALSAAFEQLHGRGAHLTLLALPPGPLHQNGDELIDGNRATLPANLLKALENAGATHLLLLLKHRADARAPFASGAVGIGRVRGLGFYVDPWHESWSHETQTRSTGFLAPFVYVRLLAIDLAAGVVLREQLAMAMRVFTVPQRAALRDPWDLMDGRQKARALESLLQAEMARMLPLVLAAG